MATTVKKVIPSTRATSAPITWKWLVRRLTLSLGIIVVAIGSYPAWRSLQFASAMSAARLALDSKNFAHAIESLNQAQRYKTNSGELEYLLAVANRRFGKLDLVEPHLSAAERLGWPAADIDLQRLLISTQLGRFLAVEPKLRALYAQGTNDQAALQIYEALAVGYWANHQIKDALDCLEFWIRWHPQDIDARLMRAEVYIEYKDPVSAEKDYLEVLKVAPDHFRTRTLLAWNLMEQGRISDSVEHFEFCRSHNHQSQQVVVGLAQAKVRLGDLEAAEKLLEGINLSELQGEWEAKVGKLKADIARFNRNHQEAVEILSGVLKHWPHDSSVHQSLAQSYAALGQRDLANRHMEESKVVLERAHRFYQLKRKVIQDSKNPELRNEVAETLWEQSLKNDAAQWWQSALRCQPTHLASHAHLAKFFDEIGEKAAADRHRQAAESAIEQTFLQTWARLFANDVEGAKKGLKALQTCSGTEPICRVLSAGLLNKESKFKEALALLDGQTFPDLLRPYAATLCGESLFGQRLPLQAEAMLLEAIKGDPDAVDAHRWLAVIYYDLGANDAAQYHLLRVAELDPVDYRPNRLLGLMNKDFELFESAIPHYQESLRRNPQQPPREEVLAELAECQIAERRYEGALETLSQAAPSDDNSAMVAECLISVGRRDEAVRILDQVLQNSPDHLRSLLSRADAFLASDQSVKAVDLLKTAVDKHPFDYLARLKLAQALPRIGAEVEARTQLAEADRLKEIRVNFAKLHEEAASKPRDPKVRRELARVAELMGRMDLRETWTKAAESLENATSFEPVAGDTASGQGTSVPSDSPK